MTIEKEDMCPRCGASNKETEFHYDGQWCGCGWSYAPAPTDQFRALIDAQKAPLPWVAGEDGLVFDANGEQVLQVDPDNDRPNLKVGAIARHLVTAINASGGFLQSSVSASQHLRATREAADAGSEKTFNGLNLDPPLTRSNELDRAMMDGPSVSGTGENHE